MRPLYDSYRIPFYDTHEKALLAMFSPVKMFIIYIWLIFIVVMSVSITYNGNYLIVLYNFLTNLKTRVNLEGDADYPCL